MATADAMSSSSTASPGAPTERSPVVGRPPIPPSRETVIERGAIRHESVRAARWSVTGTAKVTGAVEVGAVEVRGTLVVGGSLSADRIRSRGTLEVEGAVEVRGSFSSRGTLRAVGTVHAVDLDVNGVARFTGLLRVDRTCNARGVVHAPALTVGVLILEGSARVPGEIQALSVDATFREASHLGHIRARTVRLRGRVPNLVDKVFFHERTVVVERIDAEAVELTGVEAGLVRAQKIVLGRGSHVTAVDGTVVSRHPSSSIGPESKSPPPYGLRR
jgi:cytoskeletal protein CcmA (bactofilin family)